MDSSINHTNLLTFSQYNRLVRIAALKNKSIKKSTSLSNSLSRTLLQKKIWYSLITQLNVYIKQKNTSNSKAN